MLYKISAKIPFKAGIFFFYLCILKYRTFFTLALFTISELQLCHFLSTFSQCMERLSEISTTVTHSESSGCQSAVPNRRKSEGKGGGGANQTINIISELTLLKQKAALICFVGSCKCQRMNPRKRKKFFMGNSLL